MCFHSCGQYICKFIRTTESVCIRKEFNSQRVGLGHQHGSRFIVLGHLYGRRDVTWKHSIKQEYFANCIFSNSKNFRSSMHTFPTKPASRTFLLLVRFWRTRERLCLNRMRSLLSMRFMLLGYSFEPRLNNRALGSGGSVMTIGFINKRMIAPGEGGTPDFKWQVWSNGGKIKAPKNPWTKI